MLQFAERAAGYLARYHRAKLIGAHHIPDGPVMLVGNHGVYGYDTPVFFWLLRKHTGRYPIGLADKAFFRSPVTRELMPLLGGVEGTPKNAEEALARGELVVCYPGGAREVFKAPEAKYALRWERALGFVRCAARTGVPVIPFAGFGPDHAFVFGEPRMKLSGGFERYRAPLAVPLPLPFQFRFHLGEALAPPKRTASHAELISFRNDVANRVRSLLVRACHA
ncbi:MAG: lysophospholipid acyltransferase family protein [Myxococcaceae bacterium]